MKPKILKLAKKQESETLEFKLSLSQIRGIIETISAFSNTKAGSIIIGVDDRRNVIGIDIGKKTIESLANEIKQNTDPQIYASISVENIDGKNVIVIEVKESKSKPVFAFDRVYKRVGKSNHRVSSNEIRKMVIEGKKVYWDEQICEGASLEDIDEEKVKWFLKTARRERRISIKEDMPMEEALMRLNLLRNGRPTNAAILLFGENTQKFFIQSDVRCARFKGKEAVKPFADMKVFDGNIIDQVDKTMAFILDHIPLAAWLVPGKVEREERYEYPPDAIRESIVNAICHRDYESPANVQVRIFDDKIEVWNPGSLPEGWTVEKLRQTHESIPKNPLIADQFFLIKFIEKWGTGTIEMIKNCVEWGLPEPDFEFTGTSLVVAFMKSQLTNEFLSGLGLNDRQIKAIEYLKEYGEIGRKTYCNICKVEKTIAHKELSDLVEKNLIERRGKGRSSHYVLRTRGTISGRLADDSRG